MNQFDKKAKIPLFCALTIFPQPFQVHNLPWHIFIPKSSTSAPRGEVAQMSGGEG